MPDIGDDSGLVAEVSKATSISDEDEEMVASVVKKEEEQERQKHRLMQLKAKSDPITGSLGWSGPSDAPKNDEARLEMSLRAKRPIKYESDPGEHPETQDSIKWAEERYGREVGEPRLENITETW
jgi:hypothetical protein